MTGQRDEDHEAGKRNRHRDSTTFTRFTSEMALSHNDALRVVQVGANTHSASYAFSHDPVPYMISHGWSATLIEPQPQHVAKLRERYSSNSAVAVRAEAVCTDMTQTSTTLWYINTTSKSFGANHSDVRCLGDLGAISGTASLTRRQVLTHQRHYKYTPSQCAACAQRLGHPLPPTCMARVYLDNVENASVPCMQLSTLSIAHPTDVLVVDAEGHDADIVMRFLDELMGSALPHALVYEHAHLRGTTRSMLAKRLSAAGMVRAGDLRRPSKRLPSHGWTALRHALALVDGKDNSVWVLNDSAGRALLGR